MSSAQKKRKGSTLSGTALLKNATRKNHADDSEFDLSKGDSANLDAVSSPATSMDKNPVPRKKQRKNHGGKGPLIQASQIQEQRTCRPTTSHGVQGRKWRDGNPPQQSRERTQRRNRLGRPKPSQGQRKTLAANGVLLESNHCRPETIDICSGDEEADRKPAARERTTNSNADRLAGPQLKDGKGRRLSGDEAKEEWNCREEEDSGHVRLLESLCSEVVDDSSHSRSSTARTQTFPGRAKKSGQATARKRKRKLISRQIVKPGASLHMKPLKFTKIANNNSKPCSSKGYAESGDLVKDGSSLRYQGTSKHDEDGEYVDEGGEWKPGPRFKSSPRYGTNDGHAKQRKSNRLKQNHVVEIHDSEDEEDGMEATLATVAIGSRVSSSQGRLRIVNDGGNAKLTVSYKFKTRYCSHEISVNAELHEFKYRIREDNGDDRDEETTDFISMRVRPTKSNDLKQLSNSYLQDNEERPTDQQTNTNEKTYIVLDFRSHEEFRQVIASLRKVTPAFVNDDSKLPSELIGRYAASLVRYQNDSRRQAIESPRKLRRKRKVAQSGSGDENPTLLVYPFGGDDMEMEACAAGCKEAKDILSTAETAADNDTEHSVTRTRTRRSHYLTIRAEDRERLNGEIYLNDTLVDFWMQWLLRHEGPNSDVHIFTSHFYTTLLKDGPGAVESWTAKRDINIFEKKLIFVPINKSLHWSLCCIVNPGKIMNIIVYNKHSEHETEGVPADDWLGPCMLFLDSLKAHQKSTVQKNLMGWLNAEWSRLRMDETATNELTLPIHKSIVREPFREVTLRVFSPNIPYQDNGWDCGVFVCRYAYSLLKLRDVEITIADVSGTTKEVHRALKAKLTKSPAFQFGMSDIEQLRRSIGNLIDGLSRLYIIWKTNEDQNEKEIKARRKAKKLETMLRKVQQSDPSLVQGCVDGKEPRDCAVGSSEQLEDQNLDALFVFSESSLARHSHRRSFNPTTGVATNEFENKKAFTSTTVRSAVHSACSTPISVRKPAFEEVDEDLKGSHYLPDYEVGKRATSDGISDQTFSPEHANVTIDPSSDEDASSVIDENYDVDITRKSRARGSLPARTRIGANATCRAASQTRGRRGTILHESEEPNEIVIEASRQAFVEERNKMGGDANQCFPQVPFRRSPAPTMKEMSLVHEMVKRTEQQEAERMSTRPASVVNNTEESSNTATRQMTNESTKMGTCSSHPVEVSE